MEKSLKKYFALFVLPTLIAFTISFLIPFLQGIYLSFTEFNTATNFKWVGFSNYVKVFGDGSNFLGALIFTTKFAVVAIITINVFAFAIALLLTKKLSGTNLFRTVFFMPNLIGGIVLGYIWQLIINGILINTLGVDLTFAAKYGFWGLVVLTNWQLIGYMMIIYIAGIQNIPEDLLEAAKIDGATSLQLLFSIKIPLVMPSITICTYLTLTNSFKMFDQNFALTAGAPAETTSMLALDIYRTFYGRTGYEGVGQAKAVVFFLMITVLAFIQLYLTRTKEVEN
jgi:raffinose/stachyose/melibiose transport system permease protein